MECPNCENCGNKTILEEGYQKPIYYCIECGRVHSISCGY